MAQIIDLPNLKTAGVVALAAFVLTQSFQIALVLAIVEYVVNNWVF